MRFCFYQEGRQEALAKTLDSAQTDSRVVQRVVSMEDGHDQGMPPPLVSSKNEQFLPVP